VRIAFYTGRELATNEMQNAPIPPSAPALSTTSRSVWIALLRNRRTKTTRARTRTALRSVSVLLREKGKESVNLDIVFHLQHCATQCAAPKLFRMLK
jgi:Ubiquinol-cytochrome C reductase hinge protein